LSRERRRRRPYVNFAGSRHDIAGGLQWAATVEGKLAPPAYGALYRVYIGYNSAAAAGWAYTDALLCLNVASVANWQQRRCGLNASFYERRRRRLLLSEFVRTEALSGAVLYDS